jgi:hypothetical protein
MDDLCIRRTKGAAYSKSLTKGTASVLYRAKRTAFLLSGTQLTASILRRTGTASVEGDQEDSLCCAGLEERTR